MAFSAYNTGGHNQYGLKKFICDTDADIPNLPINIPAGSEAIVLKGTSSNGVDTEVKVYLLSPKGVWEEI